MPQPVAATRHRLPFIASPTDLAELPDGPVLIADDMANRVYRLHHRGSDAD